MVPVSQNIIIRYQEYARVSTEGPTCVLYYDILYYTILCTICYYDCADMYNLLIAVKAKVRNLPMEQLQQSCLLLVCKDTQECPNRIHPRKRC